jgi:hypothetical protein
LRLDEIQSQTQNSLTNLSSPHENFLAAASGSYK